MAVRSKPSNPILRPTSLSLERILKTQQNLRKSSPRIWREEEDECTDGVRTLKLSHPILRILESSTGTISEFNQIHAQLIVSGLSQHSLSAGRAIKKLCNSPSSLGHAVSLFLHLDTPDAFVCNTIIRSFLKFNGPDKALSFYHRQMLEKDVPPNHYTFPLLVKICADLGSIQEGEKTHARIAKLGLESDLFVQNSLIHMYFSFGRIKSACRVFDASCESDMVTWNSMVDGYAKNGRIDDARQIFDEMPERDVVSWNAMIAGYAATGDLKSAKELFGAMPVRDVVSWNSMIDGYAKIGEASLARELFDQMPDRNVVTWNTMLALCVRSKDYRECLRLFDMMMVEGETEPNEATLVSVLTACANLGMLDRGKWVHSYLRENRKIEHDVLLLTALLTMYAKCGDMDSAREIFEKMPERSVVSWNSMIMGYAMHGHGEKALEVFLEMEKRGLMPNDVTFICVLCACAHGGMVLEGWWYFDLMRRVYKIEPKVEHYGCMVDLLSRAGLLRDSEELIKKMPMEPAPALWGALLSACKTYSDCKLGEIVGKRLIELEPSDVGPYVLLSNIYAAEDRWDDVEKVRKMMKEKGLQKTAGLSLVDLSGPDSMSFMQETSAHKKSMVYSMLSEMGNQMKLSCRNFVVTGREL
ncbi:putative pentatricopeptide repeat-containing protein At5g37570 [Magnolia sinica]|uniref:putative pentatricopeptide repeat-containing protein At5g37570 n=1 Tax=Magnolia sinica TaxID=86752 RepID=UPI00265A96C3|nr:putative pentatricopeptide repeat-containing protein At5g37570 [Magnolia sinica]